jgi:hypothetical protein
MASLKMLITRIRTEYESSPGLKLTAAQAGHLWGVTEEICGAAMDALIGEGFLRRAASGAYFALPRPHGSTLKADRAPNPISRGRRCPHCRKLQAANADSETTAAASFRCDACQRIVA